MLRGFTTRGRLFTADTGAPSGGTDPATPPPAGEQQSQADQVLAAFQRLLDRTKGDGVALAQQLYRENYEYRDQIRALRDRQPPEGALVLTGDAAATHQQYAALGRAPAEVAQALAELETLRAQAAQRARADLVGEAAKAAGLKAPVLARLAGDELPIVLKDEQRAGKPAKAAYVTVDGKDVPLAEYATKAWPDFLPALKDDGGRPALGTPSYQQSLPPNQPRQPAAPERPLVNF